jgi:hypothetical protein
MKMRYCRFLFLFLLISFTLISVHDACAQSVEYQGWIYNTKFIIINDVTYKILITERGHSILLKSDKESTSLDLNSCEETSYKRYCFNYSEFDSEEQDFKAYLYVYSIQPVITLTRTISDNLLEVGDMSEFKATLTNTGQYDAFDVSYSEDFPENIRIESVKEGSIINNSVVWKGEIKKGETQEIRYKIKSVDETDKYQKAYVRYFDGITYKEVTSSSVRLYSPKTLQIEMTTDKEDYELNEDIDLNILLSNEGRSTITVNSLYITIPESMQVDEYDKDIVSKKGENEYFFEDSLDENDSVSIDFELSGQRDGMFFVIISGDYDYKGNNYKIQNEKLGFLVHNEGVGISTSIDPVEYVNSNQKLIIFSKVKNKNSFTKIKNLQMNTKSNLSYFNKGSYSTVDINETVILLNTEIVIPDEASEKVYPIIFNVSYITECGQAFSDSLERKIVVRPSELIKIMPTISSYNALEDEKIDVSVSLKNPKVTTFKEVYLKATISDEFQVSGPTSAFASLEASKEVKIISFSMIPKRVEKKSAFIVNFSIAYVDEGKEYTVNLEKSITVSPRVPEITIEKKIDESEIYRGELVDVIYTMKNQDDFIVHDLRLIPSESKGYDAMNLFEKDIEKISPSETLTFKGDQVRAKKTGKQDTGKAILFFKDIYDREFNVSSNTLTLNIKDAEIGGPAIFIDKYVSKSTAKKGENIELIINITNIGQERAIGNLSEDNLELILPFYANKLIRKNISFEKEGVNIIPRTVFYYTYGTNKIRAYSDEIKITVKNATAGVNENEAPEENTQTDNSGNPQDQVPKEKENFFRKIYNWFRQLFIKGK